MDKEFMDKSLVLFSGGLDSYLSLEIAIRDGGEVTPIFFNYGQNNMEIERDNVRKICSDKGLTPVEIYLTSINHLLKSDYTSGKSEENGGFNHIVPNRNLLFVTFAYNYAMINGFNKLYTGFYFKDYKDKSHIFKRIDYLLEEHRSEVIPDQTEDFLNMLNNILSYSNDCKVEIIHPLFTFSKADIFQELKKLNVLEYAIKNTISCYYASDNLDDFEWGRGCGKCVNCVDRAGAFAILK